jgi:cobalt transporter subunit CbtA
MTRAIPSDFPATKANARIYPVLVEFPPKQGNMSIKRHFTAAIIAGLLAGLIIGLLQEWRTAPLILAAEHFEQDHAHALSQLERAFYSILTAMLTGVGFASLLVGTSLLAGPPLTKSNIFVWGLCGFVAFSIAPSMGLPPELPGMPSAVLETKQFWWLATVSATAAGLWLLFIRPKPWAPFIGVALLLAPHIFGAPNPAETASSVPPHLAATFAANSLALNLLFWSLIGYLSAAALSYFNGDE